MQLNVVWILELTHQETETMPAGYWLASEADVCTLLLLC